MAKTSEHGAAAGLPTVQEGSERRRDPRFTFNAQARVRHHPAERPEDGQVQVLDISRGGARILSNRPLAEGDWVTLTSPLFKNPPPGMEAMRPGSTKVRGRVLSNAQGLSMEGRGYLHRLSFMQGHRDWSRYLVYRCLPWCALTFILAGVLGVGWLKMDNIKYFWYQPVFNTYGLLVSGYILSRFVLAIFYRPPRMGDYEPCITVIVVCKNEELSIAKTLDKIFGCDYPAAKLQVIAVNDGSTDATLSEMERVRGARPGLEIISFEKNKGKRHGMAAGARQATGEILVYVDSDSFLQADGLREMVAGFSDPAVGGVCGHAMVANAEANWLTKMQEVRYFVAFRIVKAAESLFSSVTCCSGCLAAYRRTYLMAFLDVWLAQRFMGTEATFGDDRSLTNHMLRHHRVIYNSRAVCQTIVPETWGIFFRQQLRWKKSWIRESLLATAFMWKRNPMVAFFFYFGVAFPLLSPLVVAKAMLLPLLGGHLCSMDYVLGTTLMAALFGLVYLAHFRSRLWVYGIIFSFFYMFVLVWQTYYALLTLRRNHWGTR